MKKGDVFLRLRLKMSMTLLVILAFVLLVLFAMLNVYMAFQNQSDANQFLQELDRNAGFSISRLRAEEEQPPQGFWHSILPLSRSRGFTDFYSACLDHDGKMIYVIHHFNNEEAEEGSEQFIREIFTGAETSGTLDGMGYLVAEKSYGFLVIIMDRVNELRHQRNFLLFSLLIYFVSLIVFFIVAWIGSYFTVAPVRDAFDKQKQFIADASHELKTPIAVISANIEVLQQEIKDNKWLEYIKTENSRMSALVKDMLYLAKNDAGHTDFVFVPFNVCDAVACCVLPFESVAFEQGKKLELNVPKKEIKVRGDEEKIKQSVIILTDNALKNSEKGAVIRVTVEEDNSKVLIKVYNTGHGIPAKEIPLIFNRFYRVDSSRARTTGGYGLGLAIANTIVTGHKGKITVESQLDSYTQFTVTLPVEKN
ncbi:MAG: HAMP domain-containing histidine kinase [Treponema sp.]|nr:HAMP domain-containing histidine kinase [Treponema sp.]